MFQWIVYLKLLNPALFTLALTKSTTIDNYKNHTVRGHMFSSFINPVHKDALYSTLKLLRDIYKYLCHLFRLKMGHFLTLYCLKILNFGDIWTRKRLPVSQLGEKNCCHCPPCLRSRSWSDLQVRSTVRLWFTLRQLAGILKTPLKEVRG